MSLVRTLGTIGLLCFTDFGDYLESLPAVLNCRIFHAVLDNVIHLWIGVMTWSVVSDDSSPWALTPDFIRVAIGASFIDLDHFLAAGSWWVDDALHAPHRGIFHCTGLMLVVTAFLYKYRPHWALLLMVAFIPHHLRDAQRRGLYMIPFFPEIETPPIPTGIVRFLLPAFPWGLNYFKFLFSESAKYIIMEPLVKVVTV